MRQAEWGCIDWGWLCTRPRAATRAAPSTALAVCIRLALLALWPSRVGSHSAVPLLGSREAQSHSHAFDIPIISSLAESLFGAH